jgi:PIN domain
LEPIRFLETKASKFEIKERITDCKDPADNMILELAIESNASCIITGDIKHLIPLHPFRGIPILTPADLPLVGLMTDQNRCVWIGDNTDHGQKILFSAHLLPSSWAW